MLCGPFSSSFEGICVKQAVSGYYELCCIRECEYKVDTAEISRKLLYLQRDSKKVKVKVTVHYRTSHEGPDVE